MAKILLIDDDPDVRTVMSLMLQKEGYTVRTATGREDALAAVAEEKPDLIILDVLLSGSDGRNFCRELKSNDHTSNIPIIIFSGHPSAGQQFEAYGADDFIAKPVNSANLLLKLNQKMKTA